MAHRRHRLSPLILVAVVVATTQVVAVRQPADPLAKAAALIEEGRAQGLRAQQTRDGKARSAARRAFEDAEKAIREVLRTQRQCERCEELLVSVHYGRGFVGEDRDYGDCVQQAEASLRKFPGNGRIALYKGLAHSARNEHADAARLLKRYQASAARDPEADAMVAPMLKASQDHVLSNWYNQANYYESSESRITRFNPQTFRNETIFQVTRDYELQLGAQGLNSIAQAAPPLNDPEAGAFIQQLVGRLTAKTPGPGFTYQVRLLDSPEVNAVTPPGAIIVFAGLLRFVDTEAQLAGVLAHEIAHNYGHHVPRRLIKDYHGKQVASLLTQAVNPQTQVAQAITQLSTSIGLDLFLRAYSRFEEREADLYGAHLMFNAGYNPTSLSSFFLKLYERNAKQPVKFLSTHPPAPDRVDYLTEYLEVFPLDRELVVDSSEAFKQLKARYPSQAR